MADETLRSSPDCSTTSPRSDRPHQRRARPRCQVRAAVPALPRRLLAAARAARARANGSRPCSPPATAPASPPSMLVFSGRSRGSSPQGITVAVTEATSDRKRGFKLIVGLDPRDLTVRNAHPGDDRRRACSSTQRDVLQPEQIANLIHEAAVPAAVQRARRRERSWRARKSSDSHRLELAMDMHRAGSAGTRSNLEDRFMVLVRQRQVPDAGHQHPRPRRRSGLPLGRLLRRGRRSPTTSAPTPGPTIAPTKRSSKRTG